MIEKLITKLDRAREKYTTLKLWLEQKEIVEYYSWKQDNEKDRTAMDKVVAKLKMEDVEWLEKDEELTKYKLEYDKLKDLYNVVTKLIGREDFSKEEINDLVKNIIEGV